MPPGGTSGGSSGSYEPLPSATPPGGSEGSERDGGRTPGDSGGGQSGDSQPAGGGSNEPSWNPGSGSGLPGDEQGTGQGGQQGSRSGGADDESWEEGLPGAGGSEEGWETSNQVPTGRGQIPPMPSERDKPAGDGELDGALEDFDGEILAERDVIRSRSNETAGRTGGSNLPESGSREPAGGGGTADMPDSPGGPMGVPSERNAPPAPRPVASASVPDDIPSAKDDDIIARQLREAAMQETDPVLKEKLWDEYRRYKGI